MPLVPDGGQVSGWRTGGHFPAPGKSGDRRDFREVPVPDFPSATDIIGKIIKHFLMFRF